MTMKKILPAISILLLATLACNAALPQAKPTTAPTMQAVPTQIQTQPQQEQLGLPLTEADVPRVTAKEAKLAFDNGEAVIVDVRGAEFYAGGHAAGAISIPLDQFENDIENVTLKKDQWIITYCT
jgi:3-mercaptopyruvate sulfurtransferase SseA